MFARIVLAENLQFSVADDVDGVAGLPVVEADLAGREFIPVIRMIHSVSAGAEPTDWHVVTDRGEARFVLNNEDSIRRMGHHGSLVA